MKHKVRELSGCLLDAAVAKANGWPFDINPIGDGRFCYLTQGAVSFRPSTSWTEGGPIIERENIAIQHDPTEALGRNLPDAFRPLEGRPWHAWVTTGTGQRFDAFADAPLVAAMRAFAGGKLGKEVEIP